MKKIIIAVGLLVSCLLAVGAQGRVLNEGNLSQMPGLISVPVNVEIDETGKIIKATADTTDGKLRTEAETTVSKWTVRPFSYNGQARKMRGVLIYRKAQ